MFFENWDTILRIVVMSVTSYITLIFFLRVSGKRTLSKMNAFDFIITIALGSTLSSIIVSKTTTLADGATAFFMLIGLQYVITWLSVRSKTISKIVKATPRMLYYDGNFMERDMLKERITKEEIFTAIRNEGLMDATDATAVVLETDGSLTVLKRKDDDAIKKPSLQNVIQ